MSSEDDDEPRVVQLHVAPPSEPEVEADVENPGALERLEEVRQAVLRGEVTSVLIVAAGPGDEGPVLALSLVNDRTLADIFMTLSRAQSLLLAITQPDEA